MANFQQHHLIHHSQIGKKIIDNHLPIWQILSMLALQDYLEQTNSSIAALARSIGCAPSTITRALNGKRAPSFDLALSVEVATSGSCSAEGFMLSCMKARRNFLTMISPDMLTSGEAGMQGRSSQPCIPALNNGEGVNGSI
ncbi:transcriptional regulator [Paenochrobactrum sp. BZR 588]|uniref:helix-turn-helix transcriptional regulator n=1 Tax=unclassified Paenochrobactrum TaxID=2639760 RepID=UPI0038529C3D